MGDSCFPRWPTILTNIVSTLSNEIHALTLDGAQQTSSELSAEDKETKIEEGKGIIRALSGLKHDMGRNKVLQYVTADSLLLSTCGRSRERI